MKFAKTVLNNALFVNMLAVLILVGGGLAVSSLKREAFPNVSFDVVTISTWYPGASASEVERFVTDELEKSLKTVEDIKEMTSTSIEGFSVVAMQIDADAKDKDKVVQDIKDAVDSVSTLPEEILDDPMVREIATKNQPIIEVSLTGLDEEQLREAAKDLEARYLDVNDIGGVAYKGYREKEISVDVDPRKLESYVISLAEVSNAIRSANRNMPAGTIKTAKQEYLVRTVGESETAEEIGQIVLRANDVGQLVLVKDVAEVRETFEETTRIFRTDGETSLNLTVIKKEAGDAITLVEKLKKTTDEYLATDKYPGLKVSYLNDFSFYVKRRLNVLVNNAQYGVLLVLLCLVLFLSPGISVMTALGLPIAFAGALAGLAWVGTSINLISMFGLIIVLGIVVDDAIIVSENVFHHLNKGDSPEDAVTNGVSEVILPVTATILTTIAAFSPLMMMSGIMGKFLKDMPMAVIMALTVSWFEALVILPSHLYDVMKLGEWFKRKEAQRQARREGRSESVFGKILQLRRRLVAAVGRVTDAMARAVYWVFDRQLRLFLWGRYLTLAAALSFIAFSGWWAKEKMTVVMFPADGVEIFFARIKMPMGTDLEKTSEALAKIEKHIFALDDEELDNFITDVGKTQNDPNDPFSARGSHLGQIQVFLSPQDSRERTAEEIMDWLRPRIEAMNIGYEQFSLDRVRNGPPQGKPVAVRVVGENYDTMLAVAEDLEQRIAEIEGVLGPTHDFEAGKQEIIVRVDRRKAAIASVDPETVAFQVRGAYEGLISTTLKRDDEEVDVRVRFEEDVRNRLNSFGQIRVPNRFGRLISLETIATIEQSDGIGTILHTDSERVITVSSDIDEKLTSSLQVGGIVQQWIPEIERKFQDLRIELSGGYEDTQESMETLGQAFVIALFLIFMILATLYKSLSIPFVVLAAIPFALTGVVWSFYFHGMPLSFLGVMGAIGLVGVAVNDSIVLVNFTELNRKKGIPVIDAAVEGASRRILPVWLTTITTVVGLMPVAYGWGGFDPFLKPPAVAIGWGLVVATVVTLFIIPTVYVIRFTFLRDLVGFVTWPLRKAFGWPRLQPAIWRESDKAEYDALQEPAESS